jgi:hypothetical protein
MAYFNRKWKVDSVFILIFWIHTCSLELGHKTSNFTCCAMQIKITCYRSHTVLNSLPYNTAVWTLQSSLFSMLTGSTSTKGKSKALHTFEILVPVLQHSLPVLRGWLNCWPSYFLYYTVTFLYLFKMQLTFTVLWIHYWSCPHTYTKDPCNVSECDI